MFHVVDSVSIPLRLTINLWEGICLHCYALSYSLIFRHLKMAENVAQWQANTFHPGLLFSCLKYFKILFVVKKVWNVDSDIGCLYDFLATEWKYCLDQQERETQHNLGLGLFFSMIPNTAKRFAKTIEDQGRLNADFHEGYWTSEPPVNNCGGGWKSHTSSLEHCQTNCVDSQC